MKTPIHPWIRLALAAAAAGASSQKPASGSVLVDLNFTTQPAGPLIFLPNGGGAAGGFEAIGGGGNDPAIIRPGVLGPLAAEFDGSDFLAHVEAQGGAYQIVDPTLAGPDPTRSIEVWVHNPSTVGEETMVSWGRRGGPNGTNMSFNYGTNGQFGAVGHWGAPDLGWAADGTGVPPELGVWHHLVYTFGPDPEAPGSVTTKVYSDGEMANSETIAEGIINTHADTPIAIATQINNATPAFNGGLRGTLSLARVRIHNTVLTDAEIAAAYDAEAVSYNKTPTTLRDTDGDGLDDRWESRFFGGSSQSAAGDGDGDGLTNAKEFAAHADPTDADTDDDTRTDGAEVNRLDGATAAPTNPLDPDSDDDGFSDSVETDTGVFSSITNTGTDPLKADTDGDGFSDSFEVTRNSNPNLATEVPDPLKLIALDALNRPVGPLSVWPNTGTVIGDFSAESDIPEITVVEGRRGVTLDGTGDTYRGPATPAPVTGNGSRTIEVWVFNPEMADEETMISWGRRGGGDGSNCSFNFGTNALFGAIGHWGAPDIGWNSIAQPAVWAMLAYSYDGSTRTTRVYVDGVEANTETLPNPLATHATDTTGAALRFIVGAQSEANGTRTAALQGSLTIARLDVYDQALAPTIISRHYNDLAVGFGLPPDPLTDADGDTLDDNGERFYFGSLAQGPAGDPDGDGIATSTELTRRTNPNKADTDDDGFNDGVEVDAGSDPNNPLIIPTPLHPPLAHRYGFGQSSGSDVLDSVGNGHGVIRGGGATWEPGELLLPGGASDAAAYVDLPNGIISSIGTGKGGTGKLTIEGWVTVEGAGAWPRIFDFGSNSPGGVNGEITGPGETNGGGNFGMDFLMLTGFRGTETGTRRVEWAERDPVETAPSVILDFNHTTIGTQLHFAVTFDEATDTLNYYENGVLIGTRVISFQLGDLNDVNNWLGRSNFTADSNLQGRFNELRIYDAVLTPSQVQASAVNGPNVMPSLPPVTTLAITAAVFNGTSRQATLSWLAVSGRNYLVQQSDDLINWTKAEVVAGQAGSMSWTSAAVGPEIRQRYFRVSAF